MTENQAKRILYVEDDAGLARLFIRSLQREGYLVDHADDGMMGLTMFEENQYDLVAVDQNLPLLTGLELIERLVKKENTPAIIMVTGTGDEKTAVQALKLGAQDYLVKDVDGGYLELLPTVIEHAFAKLELQKDKFRAEKALVASEERYRNLVELSPDAILVVHNQLIAFTNAAGERFLGGRDLGEVVGKNINSIFHVDSRKKVADMLTRHPVGKNTQDHKLEARLLRESGETVDVEIHLALIKHQGQRACQLVMRDITARKEAELGITQRKRELEQIIDEKTVQLEAAQQEMGFGEDPDRNRKATGVLHNVKNVLSSLLVSTKMMEKVLNSSRVDKVGQVAELFKDRRGDLGEYITKDRKGRLIPEFLSSLATVLEKEQSMILDELNGLTQHLEHMNVSIQLQQSKARVQQVCDNLDPESMFQEALRVNAVSIKRHQIHVNQDFADAVSVPAFRHMVLQILVNLIANAIEAMSDIEVLERILTLKATRCNGNMLSFSVMDRGIGIKTEMLSKVFDYGFTTRKTGHGFGLHSCLELAGQMNGTLRAESDGLGKGATFLLTLPLQPKEVEGS